MACKNGLGYRPHACLLGIRKEGMFFLCSLNLSIFKTNWPLVLFLVSYYCTLKSLSSATEDLMTC